MQDEKRDRENDGADAEAREIEMRLEPGLLTNSDLAVVVPLAFIGLEVAPALLGSAPCLRNSDRGR